jgi:hypothetical protein
VVELADIIRLAGPAYRKTFAGRILPSHLHAMDDIVRCRTAALGGSLFRCDACGSLDYSYHSCRNRHCPKCHHDQTERWLENLRSRLLPCQYYLLTFTVPDQLWKRIRSNQRAAYSILLKQAAAAVFALTGDRRWVGGRPGIVAVLHTWSRTLGYHPHVHLLVTAGGLSDDRAWIKPAHPRFLLPGYAISKIFRAKVRDAFRRADLDRDLDRQVWVKRWTVHVKHAGTGLRVAEYLSRYLHRVAITNPRIEELDGRGVTFRYIDSRTQESRRLTLPVQIFIARFLQHVLPRRFTKVRYYGLFSPGYREQLGLARKLLEMGPACNDDAAERPCSEVATPQDRPEPPEPTVRRCPHCANGHLLLIERSFSPVAIRAPP